jgi:mycobactin salicyl-AMP ligase
LGKPGPCVSPDSPGRNSFGVTSVTASLGRSLPARVTCYRAPEPELHQIQCVLTEQRHEPEPIGVGPVDRQIEPVHGLQCFGTAIRAQRQACEWEPERPTTLRLLQVRGAKLGADDARTVRAALTPGLQQVFGMAEGLLNYTRLGDPADIVDNTQGRPLSEHDELRVVDEAGNEVTAGAKGELLVRGPYTLNGYFNAARENERSFSPDGFYRTGDRVRRVANGYLEVTGRVKDVILRGGENVSALDLEEHLLTHPSVWAAAAVPLPDGFSGEKICAAVVFSGPPVTLSELNGFLDERGVAAHSRPDVLVPMERLPTTAVGKVDKRSIIEQLSG